MALTVSALTSNLSMGAPLRCVARVGAGSVAQAGQPTKVVSSQADSLSSAPGSRELRGLSDASTSCTRIKPVASAWPGNGGRVHQKGEGVCDLHDAHFLARGDRLLNRLFDEIFQWR